MELETTTVTLEADAEAETEAIAARLARVVPAGTIVVLTGPLGAGKTRFVKAFASAWDVSPDEVASPTFVLCKHYQGTRPITHMDVYRLSDVDEFENLGPEDLYAADGVTFIEWGERVADSLPEARIEVTVEIVSEKARRFHIKAHGPQGKAALGSL